jgi:hypothetical protein
MAGSSPRREIDGQVVVSARAASAAAADDAATPAKTATPVKNMCVSPE